MIARTREADHRIRELTEIVQQLLRQGESILFDHPSRLTNQVRYRLPLYLRDRRNHSYSEFLEFRVTPESPDQVHFAGNDTTYVYSAEKSQLVHAVYLVIEQRRMAHERARRASGIA